MWCLPQVALWFKQSNNNKPTTESTLVYLSRTNTLDIVGRAEARDYLDKFPNCNTRNHSRICCFSSSPQVKNQKGLPLSPTLGPQQFITIHSWKTQTPDITYASLVCLLLGRCNTCQLISDREPTTDQSADATKIQFGEPVSFIEVIYRNMGEGVT